MDEPNSQANQQNPDNNPKQNVSTGTPIVRPDLNTDNARSHNDTAHKLDDPAPNSRFSQIVMVIATVVIAISTTIYTLYARQQLQVMSNTLGTMKHSGDEAKTQTDRMITETNRIADSMKETVQQSKRALDATIENFHLDQRAWIGATTVSDAEYTEGDKKVYVKEGQNIKVRVYVVNSGKTPALNVHNNIFIQILSPDIDPFKTPKVIKTYESGSIMQPGMKSYLETPSIPIKGVVTKSVIDNIANGKGIVYITGIITYEDIFKRSHFTKLCLRLTSDLTTFYTCNTGNEIN